MVIIGIILLAGFTMVILNQGAEADRMSRPPRWDQSPWNSRKRRWL